MDPPRPLEPKPTHDGAFASGTTLERRSDALGYAVDPRSNLRLPVSQPMAQTLPSVRDILSPRQAPLLHPQYDTYPTHHYPPAPQHLHPQAYQSRPHLSHSPAAHLARLEHFAQPPTPNGRHDLPAVETHPSISHTTISVPPAYAPPQYRDVHREHSESVYSRPRQQSASSYATGSVSSPYTPNTYDDAASRGSTSGYDKYVTPPFPPNGAETTKRYLGVQEIPGEGTFHVYEGGHRLPTEVDGQSVNPQWGLTKANKPRKRLAIACLDCREKKIKCEPGASSCLQCEKAKRPCRR